MPAVAVGDWAGALGVVAGGFTMLLACGDPATGMLGVLGDCGEGLVLDGLVEDAAGASSDENCFSGDMIS